jgi:uncharacterized heparinase superfamily protein
MKKISIFWNTIKYLKWVQIYSRIWLHVPRKVLVPKSSPRLRSRKKIWIDPVPKTASLTIPWRFTFLNKTDDCHFPEDWDSKKSKLWVYNLHYFDDLLATDAHARVRLHFELIQKWIAENRPGYGSGWESFPISIRCVNWIKWSLNGSQLPAAALRSLVTQIRLLHKRLEFHLLGNHLFKNAKALLFAGLYFQGSEAEGWLDKGLAILDHELNEQVLADGGHFERSPMYHTMILEDCLDLLNLGLVYKNEKTFDLINKLKKTANSMAHFLVGMTHPDNKIALLNDAALNVEPPPHQILAYYKRLTNQEIVLPKQSCWSFPETGYFVMAPHKGNRMVVDCGPVGPDFQPGHSHCDTLSFELSLKNKRVIVDSGCFQYEDSPIRRYNRGNAGHNSVTVGGQNQSEVWRAHRCARRARPLYANLEVDSKNGLTFQGAHDGYCRLPGAPIHHRRIVWREHTYIIEDVVKGRGRHDIESRLHIHPALSVKLEKNRVVLKSDQTPLAYVGTLGSGRLETDVGYYCPEFGLKQRCMVLKVTIQDSLLPYRGGWLIHATQKEQKS